MIKYNIRILNVHYFSKSINFCFGKVKFFNPVLIQKSQIVLLKTHDSHMCNRYNPRIKILIK